ncbi:MAG: hypothetical protein K8E66_14595, partial [Phycisphaerales bacterium]|nr:hypothetical protein [Phycisphaerales bacterium]
MRLLILVMFSITAILTHDAAAAPEPLVEAARLLADEPWSTVIEVTVQTSGEEARTQMDEIVIWYDPAGVARLRLGRLSIEARPGRFVAFHEWNNDAYYEAELPGASIAEVLRAELPPLWCPWLAVALSGGDPG